jgi:hypothetical protein
MHLHRSSTIAAETAQIDQETMSFVKRQEVGQKRCGERDPLTRPLGMGTSTWLSLHVLRLRLLVKLGFA